jgi:hypothetical protein
VTLASDRRDERHLPFCRKGELAALWRQHGLLDVVEEGLTIETRFRSFADYWTTSSKSRGRRVRIAALSTSATSWRGACGNARWSRGGTALASTRALAAGHRAQTVARTIDRWRRRDCAGAAVLAQMRVRTAGAATANCPAAFTKRRACRPYRRQSRIAIYGELVGGCAVATRRTARC